jgi:hypothetical protein
MRIWAKCGTQLISALGKMRQEDQEFENSLAYMSSWKSAWTTKQDLSKQKKFKEQPK